MLFDEDSLQRHYRFCWALTQNASDAQDLLQSSLEKVLRKPPADKTRIHAYLRTTIRREFIDQCRRPAELTNMTDDDNIIALAAEDSIDKIVVKADELAWIWRKLDSVEQDILFLWALEDMSYAEISEELNMPRGTILAKVHRLRRRIEQLVSEPTGGTQCLNR